MEKTIFEEEAWRVCQKLLSCHEANGVTKKGYAYAKPWAIHMFKMNSTHRKMLGELKFTCIHTNKVFHIIWHVAICIGFFPRDFLK
jgi:hypothetical protein